MQRKRWVRWWHRTHLMGFGVSGTIAEGAGGGGGYRPHVCEVWWAGVQWEAQRIKKSEHHSNRERRREEEKQKNEQKKEKIHSRDKKQKKQNCFPSWSHFASTPKPSQKAPGAALWTTDASRFGLSIGHSTYCQFI